MTFSGLLWMCLGLCVGTCTGLLLGMKDMCGYVSLLDCSHNKTGPICGRNGITYQDRCEFSKAFCRDPSISFHHLGPCLQQQEKQAVVLEVACPTLMGMNCAMNSDNLDYCASDGLTYLGTYVCGIGGYRRCRFEKARCRNKNLFLRYMGHCN